ERRRLCLPARFRRGIKKERPDRQPDRAARHGQPAVGRAAGVKGERAMKAAYLTGHGGTDKFVFGDLPDPVAGPGEVVVDVHAASVNAADYKVRLGGGAYSGASKLKFPYIL